MELIGKGMTAEIFSLEDNKVIKLYHEKFGSELAEHEASIAEVLNTYKLNAPKYFGKKTHEGRIGLVYERIQGHDLILDMTKPFAPVFAIIKRLANEQYKINSIKTDGNLISQKERLSNMINLSKDALGEFHPKIIERLSGLSSKNNLCHGDYHPLNIICRDNEYIPIDWMNAYSGNGISDAVRTYMMFISPFLPPETPAVTRIFLKFIKPLLGIVFKREYLRISKEDKKTFNDWIPIMAAARLVEQIPGEELWLMRLIKQNI